MSRSKNLVMLVDILMRLLRSLLQTSTLGPFVLAFTKQKLSFGSEEEKQSWD